MIRQIRQTQEPGAEKGVVPAEGLLGIGVDAAGHGAAGHQIGEVFGDHEHDDHADQHGECRPRGPGHRQEGGAGHGKHTPADHAAQRHAPYIQRR